MTGEVTAYHAAAICDAAGTAARPGVVIERGGRVVASGHPDDLPRDLVRHARRVDLPDRLLMPAMVNVHVHLELTAVGPRPYTGSFTSWVRMLIAHRPNEPQAVRTSVEQGVRLLREAGVAAVGDIGGGRIADGVAAEVLGASALAGVHFGEFIAHGRPIFDQESQRLAAWSQRRPQNGSLRLGIQPHAPYSTSPTMYEACVDAAVAAGMPLSTHLAETLDEAAFVARAEGPFRAFLVELGVWNDHFAQWYRDGLSPVQWMRPHLERARWLLAHCNYVSDNDIALLADTGASVAYCPIASEYFGHPFAGYPPHRYRDMLEAGVNVCLGTDSIVCQPQAAEQPMSILAQMRRLYQRDRTDPETLLAMATTRGMRALQLDERDATLQPGASAAFATVQIDADNPTDPLIQSLLSSHLCHSMPPLR